MANNSQFGLFVPTTDVYDSPYNPQSDPNGENLNQLLVRIRQNTNNISLALNLKDSGYYLPAEFVNGQLYFPNRDPAITSPSNKNAVYRQVYRMTVDFGALPNTGTKSVPHMIPDINSQFTATRIYGAATDPATPVWIPIPNIDALGFVYISVDATNVNITTTFDATAYTRCLVVIEYLKS